MFFGLFLMCFLGVFLVLMWFCWCCLRLFDDFGIKRRWFWRLGTLELVFFLPKHRWFWRLIWVVPNGAKFFLKSNLWEGLSQSKNVVWESFARKMTGIWAVLIEYSRPSWCSKYAFKVFWSQHSGIHWVFQHLPSQTWSLLRGYESFEQLLTPTWRSRAELLPTPRAPRRKRAEREPWTPGAETPGSEDGETSGTPRLQARALWSKACCGVGWGDFLEAFSVVFKVFCEDVGSQKVP